MGAGGGIVDGAGDIVGRIDCNTADGCAGYMGVWTRMGGGPIAVADGLGVGTEYGAGPGRGMLSRGRLGSGEPLPEKIRENNV